jgi:hypothetical protein
VVAIDKEKRVVTFRGTRGNLVDMQVPPESQNLDQVKKGSGLQDQVRRSTGGADHPRRRRTLPGRREGDEAREEGRQPRRHRCPHAPHQRRIEAIDLKNRYVAVRDRTTRPNRRRS